MDNSFSDSSSEQIKRAIKRRNQEINEALGFGVGTDLKRMNYLYAGRSGPGPCSYDPTIRDHLISKKAEKRIPRNTKIVGIGNLIKKVESPEKFRKLSHPKDCCFPGPGAYNIDSNGTGSPSQSKWDLKKRIK